MRRSVFLALALALLAGCCNTPRPAVMPTYSELAARYNRNLEHFSRMWSSSTVELRWQDDGKMRREQGEGNLILEMPDKLVLTMGVVGQTVIWAGCDSDRYWFFDLRNGVVYTGLHANLGKPTTRSLPAPVQPLEVPELLGVLKWPTGDQVLDVPVTWDHCRFVVEPPGMAQRVYLDPVDAHPVRIEMLDSAGKVRLVAEQDYHKTVAIQGVASDRWPYIATYVKVTAPGRPGSLELHLDEMTNDPDLFNPRAFDYQKLLQAHKPKQVIDLDAGP